MRASGTPPPRAFRADFLEDRVRQDLDRLMRERGLAGLVIFAHDRYSPAMYYVTGQKIHYGIYFKSADGGSLLVHDPMERDQAALAGGPHTSFAELGLNRMVESEGHPARAFGRLIAERCAALGMRGPVSFFGDAAIGYAHTMIARALEVQPGLAVDQSHPDILTIARTTKEPDEIAAIRKAALVLAPSALDTRSSRRRRSRWTTLTTDKSGP